MANYAEEFLGSHRSPVESYQFRHTSLSITFSAYFECLPLFSRSEVKEKEERGKRENREEKEEDGKERGKRREGEGKVCKEGENRKGKENRRKGREEKKD